MKFFLNETWQSRSESIEIVNPFDGSVVDTVPVATAADVELALQTAVAGAAIMKEVSGYERSVILRKAAELMHARSEELARTISLEVGKTLNEARSEVDRSIQTIELSGEEAKRLGGELLPLDGGKGTAGKLGFTLRVPCGVVVAISPFNFPLNLVCHKVGPALAGGNAVILKPASNTPLVALKLTEILLAAGLPPLAISCLTGDGRMIGNLLCADRRVRKITFTGSQAVGEHICRIAGIKRVTMELGSNCPMIVLPDADLEKVAAATVASGYANAGQVCISAQRMIVVGEIYDEVIARLQPRISAIKAGNQLETGTQMGPMVRAAEAERVLGWVQEAVQAGARVVCGGTREGSLVQPTLVAGATPDMKICREELFGPAVAVLRARDAAEAIRLANDSRYGLSAAVFTQDVDLALRFAREIHSGNVHINGGPLWRTDLMPYGGLKDSGLGKEGPKYAVEEMTEMKAVVIHSTKS